MIKKILSFLLTVSLGLTAITLFSMERKAQDEIKEGKEQDEVGKIFEECTLKICNVQILKEAGTLVNCKDTDFCSIQVKNLLLDSSLDPQHFGDHIQKSSLNKSDFLTASSKDKDFEHILKLLNKSEYILHVFSRPISTYFLFFTPLSLKVSYYRLTLQEERSKPLCDPEIREGNVDIFITSEENKSDNALNLVIKYLQSSNLYEKIKVSFPSGNSLEAYCKIRTLPPKPKKISYSIRFRRLNGTYFYFNDERDNIEITLDPKKLEEAKKELETKVRKALCQKNLISESEKIKIIVSTQSLKNSSFEALVSIKLLHVHVKQTANSCNCSDLSACRKCHTRA